GGGGRCGGGGGGGGRGRAWGGGGGPGGRGVRAGAARGGRGGPRPAGPRGRPGRRPRRDRARAPAAAAEAARAPRLIGARSELRAAAVDVDALPVHVGGAGSDEEVHHRGDLLGRAHVAVGEAGEDPLAHLARHVGGEEAPAHFGVGEARRHDVHAQSVLALLLREHEGERLDGGLAHRIGR